MPSRDTNAAFLVFSTSSVFESKSRLRQSFRVSTSTKGNVQRQQHKHALQKKRGTIPCAITAACGYIPQQRNGDTPAISRQKTTQTKSSAARAHQDNKTKPAKHVFRCRRSTKQQCGRTCSTAAGLRTPKSSKLFEDSCPFLLPLLLRGPELVTALHRVR